MTGRIILRLASLFKKALREGQRFNYYIYSIDNERDKEREFQH